LCKIVSKKGGGVSRNSAGECKGKSRKGNREDDWKKRKGKPVNRRGPRVQTGVKNIIKVKHQLLSDQAFALDYTNKKGCEPKTFLQEAYIAKSTKTNGLYLIVRGGGV